MSTQFTAESIVGPPEREDLAEVIDLPVDTLSFYQRNSGALPKSGAGMSDAHRRAQLPTAVCGNDEPFLVRVKYMLGLWRETLMANRP
jgi:hypothetical protein